MRKIKSNLLIKPGTDNPSVNNGRTDRHTVHLESNVCGSCKLSMVVSLGFQRDSRGLAAAKMDVRAFNEQMIPALAIDSVCCSYTPISKETSNVLNKMIESTNHDFMKHSSGTVIHLIKLINTTYATITQNKSTTTQWMANTFIIVDKIPNNYRY